MTNITHNKQKSANNNVYIYCDGGARGNPGPGASAFVVKNSQGVVVARGGKYLGKTTNNIAEYMAVIEALSWLEKSIPSVIEPPAAIKFFLDSLLVANQLNGLFKIKDHKLKELVIKIRGLENQIKADIIYQHVPRSQNFQADELVNEILDKSLLNKIR
jgi:ribonuclease HI